MQTTDQLFKLGMNKLHAINKICRKRVKPVGYEQGEEEHVRKDTNTSAMVKASQPESKHVRQKQTNTTQKREEDTNKTRDKQDKKVMVHPPHALSSVFCLFACLASLLGLSREASSSGDGIWTPRRRSEWC